MLDDRYDSGSTIITSQLEPEEWHAVIGDPTLADAICDRLVHNAHRIKMNDAESIRKTATNLNQQAEGVEPDQTSLVTPARVVGFTRNR